MVVDLLTFHRIHMYPFCKPLYVMNSLLYSCGPLFCARMCISVLGWNEKSSYISDFMNTCDILLKYLEQKGMCKGGGVQWLKVLPYYNRLM